MKYIKTVLYIKYINIESVMLRLVSELTGHVYDTVLYFCNDSDKP
jgi:hypothetical protein